MFGFYTLILLQDGTGLVSANDMRQFMMNLGEKLSEEEADDLVREAELDTEGHFNYEGKL